MHNKGKTFVKAHPPEVRSDTPRAYNRPIKSRMQIAHFRLHGVCVFYHLNGLGIIDGKLNTAHLEETTFLSNVALYEKGQIKSEAKSD